MSLQWWSIPRKGWLIILVELAAIIGLSSWVVSEYFNNVFFQDYVNRLSPTLAPVLSVAFGVGSIAVAVGLYYRTRMIQAAEKTKELVVDRRGVDPDRSVSRTMLAEAKRGMAEARPSTLRKTRPVGTSKAVADNRTARKQAIENRRDDLDA